jgi:hypothetical protein
MQAVEDKESTATTTATTTTTTTTGGQGLKDTATSEGVSKGVSEGAKEGVSEGVSEGVAQNKNPWTSINDMLCNNRCFICTQGFPRGKKKKVFMVSQILQSFTAIYASKDRMPPPPPPSAEQQKSGEEDEDREGEGGSASVSASVSGQVEDLKQSDDIGSEKKEGDEQQKEESGEGGDSSAWTLDERTGSDPRLILFINFKEQCPHVWACWQSFFSLAGSPEREQELVDMLADVDVQVWMSGLACCRSDMCAAMYRAITSDNSKNERIASILASKEKFTHKNTFCPPDCDCDSPWQFMNM